jgi:hypothetical protein
MYYIDYHFVRVNQLLFSNKVCSKMHGLPCRGLGASIKGCYMKNGPRQPRKGQVKKVMQQTPSLLGMPCNFCFAKFSVKCMVWLG